MNKEEIEQELKELDEGCEALVKIMQANFEAVKKMCDRKYQLKQQLKTLQNDTLE